MVEKRGASDGQVDGVIWGGVRWWGRGRCYCGVLVVGERVMLLRGFLCFLLF